jgi:phosphatidylglycerophosphate synthase
VLGGEEARLAPDIDFKAAECGFFCFEGEKGEGITVKPLLAATLAVSVGLALASFLLVIVSYVRGRACETAGERDYLGAWQRSELFTGAALVGATFLICLVLRGILKGISF